MHVISQKEAGLGDVDVVEDGETFEENSFKKANEIMKLSGKIAVADDSGLEVDYLGGAPGVYSARYAGEHKNDLDNNNKLLKELEGVPAEKRTAHFTSVVTMVYPDGKVLHARESARDRFSLNPGAPARFSDTILSSCRMGWRRPLPSAARRRRILSVTGPGHWRNWRKCWKRAKEPLSAPTGHLPPRGEAALRHYGGGKNGLKNAALRHYGEAKKKRPDFRSFRFYSAVSGTSG